MSENASICRGCGASLQSEDMALPGYVPQGAKNRPDGEVLCRRCFRIRHYGEFTPVNVTEADYQEQVSQIFDRPGLVLYVVDVFDLAGSLVKGLARFVMNSEVVVVVNKVDLLPRETYYEGLRDWIRTQVEATRVQVCDVVFLSAAKDIGVEDLLADIMQETNRPIYVVGMANTGKSTLLNAIARHFDIHTDPYTVSRRPGTTLALSKMTLPGPKGPIELVDTPGLVHGTRVIDRLCADCLSLAVPNKRVNPRIFQLNPEQTLFLGGIARLDFESGYRQSIVLYVSNELPIHRTKLERADAIWNEHRTDILTVPCPNCQTSFSQLKSHLIESTRAGRRVPQGTIAVTGRGRDIVIPGLGWIALSGDTFKGKLWLPGWLQPAHRPRLVGELTHRPRGERSFS